jgi:hypothetical protein
MNGIKVVEAFHEPGQSGRVVIEDNVIELVPTLTNYGPPSAMDGN